MSDFNNLAKIAMHTNKRVLLDYHGDTRLVEVHALGLSAKGLPCVRVYQVMSSAKTSEEGWRMLSLKDIENAALIDQDASAPRPGYKPNDIGMSYIMMEISNEAVPIEAPT